MATLVDSNVLLDVMTLDRKWFEWSSNALANAADSGRLIINPVIYAEISIRFSTIEALEDALPDNMFDRDPIPFAAAFLAGKVFMSYRKRSGIKRSPLPDFFIGAHAALAGHTLLTRDAKRYRSYFSNLDLITPTRA